MGFPIDLGGYRALSLSSDSLESSKKQLEKNISLVRDSIVFFTGYANARGLGGHTGGAYDIVPELLIIDGLIRGKKPIYPVFFDEAGHRVAIQYMMAALEGDIKTSDLLHYREYKSGLPGHPELDLKRGVKFSSGRLGHLWGHVNGVAEAHPDKKIVLFGSDGAQQEGNDSEAARYCVAKGCNVLLLIDDNNVTIEGHPADYLGGFDVESTLRGHGLHTDVGEGEDLDELYSRILNSLKTHGPVALINKRLMAVGVEGIENSTKGHDAIPADAAMAYLKKKGHTKAAQLIASAEKVSDKTVYLGSDGKKIKNRATFGEIICDILKKKPVHVKNTLVVSNDLGGSCGLEIIGKNYPKIYRKAGVMERNNFLVAAGFGSTKGKQGIYGTFSAFLEMVISEITMSRLNECNVLAHFSHAGVDDMADNTCHFGSNIFFADNGLVEMGNTKLYFAADAAQFRAIVESVFSDSGLRFIFSTRSGVPHILDEKGKKYYDSYSFSHKDDIIREGPGYIVSYGEMLYRALDAVEYLKKKGVDVGLINKACLNVIDESMMKKLSKASFVYVVETQNQLSGLGVRFGTWLLERGFSGNYAHNGVVRPGAGGLSDQIPYQGLDSASIQKAVSTLL